MPQNRVHICSGNNGRKRGRERGKEREREIEEFRSASLVTLTGNSGSVFVVNSGSADIWGAVTEL